MVQTFGKSRLALTPFPTRAIEATVRDGFSDIKQSSDLVRLGVVFDYLNKEESIHLKPGDSVWVKGDLAKSSNYAKVITTAESGKSFILLPFSEIILCESAK